MPSNITLKNVPDEVHMRLREAAQAHHRSVNSQAIVCLEQVLLPHKASRDEALQQLRAFRATLPFIDITNEEMNELKNVGRP